MNYEHIWKYRLLVTIPFIHCFSHHLIFCIDSQFKYKKCGICCKDVLNFFEQSIIQGILLFEPVLQYIEVGPIHVDVWKIMEEYVFHIFRFVNLYTSPSLI